MQLKPLFISALVIAAASPAAVGQGSNSVDAVAEEVALANYLTPRERLGRLLFHDTNLSEPAGQSCATCHAVDQAFTDPDQKVPTSQGVDPKLFGNRNTPTAMYMAYSPAFHFEESEEHYEGGQFVDGRAPTLEEQAKGPFLNPLEMANPDRQTVIGKVRNASYAGLFKAVFGQDSLDDPDRAYELLALAIADYEHSRAFNRFSSKYDAWLAGKAQLTAQERRGLDLYEREDKGNCAACHPNRPANDDILSPPLFTDFTYDNLGVPKNIANPFYRLPKAYNPDGWSFVDKGLGGALGLATENGKFKVPTLRNIAVTGPYMHNGYFRTLKGVVDFYNTRDVKRACRSPWTTEAVAKGLNCWPAAEVADNVNADELGNLGLSDREVDDIVAFLRTLTDGWMPANNGN